MEKLHDVELLYVFRARLSHAADSAGCFFTE